MMDKAIDREIRLGDLIVEKQWNTASAVTDADNNPFRGNGANLANLIEPIYSQNYLAELPEVSAEFKQVVACMVANTVGFGVRAVKRDDDSEINEDEMIDLKNFIEYANPDDSLQSVLSAGAWDFYLNGNMYLEVIRNKGGRPSGISRVPAYKVRLTTKEKTPFSFQMSQALKTRDGYVVKKKTEYKRFRLFAQHNQVDSHAGVMSTGEVIWFKEFGDPRQYDRLTGELLKTKSAIRKARSAGTIAHEILHVTPPLTRGPYGFPNHIGNIESIEGDRFVSRTNLATFKNNMIPSMVFAFSGGRATEKTIERLTSFTETKFGGRSDNRSRFLVLEAEAHNEEEDSGRAKIDVKSLHEGAKEDQMFGKFSDNCRASIRRSFRIPELLVARGMAQSARVISASTKLADEQVFAQDRQLFVDAFNRKILPELGIANTVIELNSPNVTDAETLVSLLSAAERTGSLTPAISRQIIEEILSTKFASFPEGFPSDVPFTLTQAEAVKKLNEDGQNNPTGSNEPKTVMNKAIQTEPTQQFISQPNG